MSPSESSLWTLQVAKKVINTLPTNDIFLLEGVSQWGNLRQTVLDEHLDSVQPFGPTLQFQVSQNVCVF